MKRLVVLVVLGLAFVAAGGTRKVLVLPLDGNAPAAQRSKLNASVVKLAKKNVTGDVTVGDTTFAETAAAVGCDPKSDECAQTVLSTLAVDEIVYGTATKSGSSTTVEVKRVTKGATPRSQSTTIAASDAADKAEPGLEPVFGTSAPVGTTGAAGSGVAGTEQGSGAAGEGSAVVDTRSPRPRPAHGISFFDTRDRVMGVSLAAGGVVLVAIGVSLWISKNNLQDQIDSHPTRTISDFNDLKALEDRASSKALWGNILVVVGVGVGAAGGYFLWRDHKNREAGITPAPTEGGTGMTLNYGGTW